MREGVVPGFHVDAASVCASPRGFGLYLSREIMIGLLSQYQPLDDTIIALRVVPMEEGKMLVRFSSCTSESNAI